MMFLLLVVLMPFPTALSSFDDNGDLEEFIYHGEQPCCFMMHRPNQTMRSRNERAVILKYQWVCLNSCPQAHFLEDVLEYPYPCFPSSQEAKPYFGNFTAVCTPCDIGCFKCLNELTCEKCLPEFKLHEIVPEEESVTPPSRYNIREMTDTSESILVCIEGPDCHFTFYQDPTYEYCRKCPNGCADCQIEASEPPLEEVVRENFHFICHTCANPENFSLCTGQCFNVLQSLTTTTIIANATTTSTVPEKVTNEGSANATTTPSPTITTTKPPPVTPTLTYDCVQKCPDGYWSRQAICTECHASCAICVDGSPVECPKCKSVVWRNGSDNVCIESGDCKPGKIFCPEGSSPHLVPENTAQADLRCACSKPIFDSGDVSLGLIIGMIIVAILIFTFIVLMLLWAQGYLQKPRRNRLPRGSRGSIHIPTFSPEEGTRGSVGGISKNLKRKERFIEYGRRFRQSISSASMEVFARHRHISGDPLGISRRFSQPAPSTSTDGASSKDGSTVPPPTPGILDSASTSLQSLQKARKRKKSPAPGIPILQEIEGTLTITESVANILLPQPLQTTTGVSIPDSPSAKGPIEVHSAIESLPVATSTASSAPPVQPTSLPVPIITISGSVSQSTLTNGHTPVMIHGMPEPKVASTVTNEMLTSIAPTNSDSTGIQTPIVGVISEIPPPIDNTTVPATNLAIVKASNIRNVPELIPDTSKHLSQEHDPFKKTFEDLSERLRKLQGAEARLSESASASSLSIIPEEDASSHSYNRSHSTGGILKNTSSTNSPSMSRRSSNGGVTFLLPPEPLEENPAKFKGSWSVSNSPSTIRRQIRSSIGNKNKIPPFRPKSNSVDYLESRPLHLRVAEILKQEGFK